MHKKKLIEVAIPIDAINREAAREKSIRHGHPSSLHLWWARRPLAACRAVLFASLVDDPSSNPERFPTEEDQSKERDRLFDLIGNLVKWENSTNSELLDEARHEIRKSCGDDTPPFLDPFAGGGSIPLEAQRLGLHTYASDLNPVAVLMNKALVEVPPGFLGGSPVRPNHDTSPHLEVWSGSQGIAEDVRYYGEWVRQEALRRLGHFYPPVQISSNDGNGEATVIAWIWAHTVQSPNPAWNGHVPLVRSFELSTRRGKEAWVQPIVDGEDFSITFNVCTGPGDVPEGTVGRSGGRCLATGTPIPLEYIREEFRQGRSGVRLMAVVANADSGRIYVSPDDVQVNAAQEAVPTWRPSGEINDNPGHTNVYRYGMTTWDSLFTERQLSMLGMFSDLVSEVSEQVQRDAEEASTGPSTARGLTSAPAVSAAAYRDAISLYLGLCVGKLAAAHNIMSRWRAGEGKSAPAFGRQAMAMVWDFAEVNPFAGAGGDWAGIVNGAASVLERLRPAATAEVEQISAEAIRHDGVLISTDPPYYDNIPYADLSDFFYVWLRRSLSMAFPDECSTLLVPKTQELVASAYRFGGDKKLAENFFESGLSAVFRRLSAAQDPRFPLTVYYAFKQSESSVDGIASTGWETMLKSVLDAGLAIDGTWPLRTEGANRLIAAGSNALATSIVLVCRPREKSAPLATRKEFFEALKRELPSAVRALQHGSIAPVDMAQAAIGPGMAVFSRYSRILEADGSTMSVRSALELINQVLDETIAGTDSDFDGDTRWAVTWFEDCGMDEGDFGRAEQLSKSRNTSVDGLANAGVVTQRPGKVRLTARDELPDTWDPRSDKRLTVWEVTQHLIFRLEHQGEAGAAELLVLVGGVLGETAKELAYRLYLICERRGWAKDAMSYNALVSAWPELTRLAASIGRPGVSSPTQGELL